MKKNKAKFITGAIIFTMLAATGCGTSSDKTSEETSLPIEVSEDIVGAIEDKTDETSAANSAQPETEPETEDSSETEAVSEYKLVPDNVEANLADTVELNLITINGTEINICDYNLADAMDKVGIAKSGAYPYSYNGDDYYFTGERYSSTLYGAEVYVEITQDGQLVTAYDKEQTSNYTLKGISSKRNTDDNEYVLFYGGIHVEMDSSSIEQILGKGMEVSDTEAETKAVYYRNTAMSMIINYDYEGTAEKITAIIN